MKYKRMLALLMAFGLVAAACGSSSDGETSDTTAADAGGDTETTEASDDGGDEEEPMEEVDPADLAFDSGVTDTAIRIGINADLSGPFAGLVSEIVEGQSVYWEWVNENGGIGGRDVELEILDSGYATDKGIENYEVLAQDGPEGVVMISENTGSPITAAIAPDAADDDMLVVPLSWASLWPAEPNILGKQSTYCAESMNGISYLAAKVEADGDDAGSWPFSRDPVSTASTALSAPVSPLMPSASKWSTTAPIRLPATTALRSSPSSWVPGANMVWLTPPAARPSTSSATPSARASTAYWSGNSPSFDYKVHLASDFAAEFDQYWTHSTYQVGWNGNDSQAMQDMVREMTARRPDLPLSDVYSIGLDRRHDGAADPRAGGRQRRHHPCRDRRSSQPGRDRLQWHRSEPELLR